jgi:hypothetical protein
MIIDFSTSAKGSPLPLLQRLFDADTERGQAALAPSETDAEDVAPFRLIVGSEYQPCEWPTAARWVPTPTPSPPQAGN